MRYLWLGVRVSKMDIIIATGNKGKVKEFECLLQPLGYQVKCLKDFPEIEDIEETGLTFEENACLKAEYLAKQLDCMVIADDSGLTVDALNGEPGVFSARYAGVEKDDEKNLQLVLEKLKDVPENQRQARFVCVMALAKPDVKTKVYRGECEGMIIHEKRGENGFGYDPIFFLPEYGCTTAELTQEQKGKISHRGKALSLLLEDLQ